MNNDKEEFIRLCELNRQENNINSFEFNNQNNNLNTFNDKNKSKHEKYNANTPLISLETKIEDLNTDQIFENTLNIDKQIDKFINNFNDKYTLNNNTNLTNCKPIVFGEILNKESFRDDCNFDIVSLIQQINNVEMILIDTKSELQKKINKVHDQN